MKETYNYFVLVCQRVTKMSTAVSLSDNCDSYTDHASSIIQYRAVHELEDKCVVSGSIMSCQKEQYERPDAKTLNNIIENVKSAAAQNIHCQNIDLDKFQIETKPVILGATSTELDGEDIARRHMASNCADGFDLGKINTHNYYTCRNFGEMTQKDGKKVRNYHKVWDGILPSCEQNVELSLQTEEDIKKLVQYRNKLNGIDMKLEDIACDIYGSSV